MALSEAIVIMSISPILTTILDFLLTGETYVLNEIIAAAVCLLGIIFIWRPAFIFGRDDSNENEHPNRALGTLVCFI